MHAWKGDGKNGWRPSNVFPNPWPLRERGHSGRKSRANKNKALRASRMALAAAGDQRMSCTSRMRAPL